MEQYSATHKYNTLGLAGSLLITSFLLSACSVVQDESKTKTAKTETKPAVVVDNTQCVGKVGAPPVYVPWLTEVDDPTLLAESVKKPKEGGLCKAKAYKVNKPFEIYRAWNSNNPNGAKGKWWSFTIPSGKVSEYRSDYAICPKFSPLDMMERCKVKEGAHLVLGTGQSAYCNQYLTYQPSPKIQIFLPSAGEQTMECRSYNGIFNWQPLRVVPVAEPEQVEWQDDSN
jgi:hypothetical protein